MTSYAGMATFRFWRVHLFALGGEKDCGSEWFRYAMVREVYFSGFTEQKQMIV